MQPLKMRRDYGEDEEEMEEIVAGLLAVAKELVNPYLNTPPTKLKRDLKNQKSKKKRKKMEDALGAWRTVVPGPFRKAGV